MTLGKTTRMIELYLQVSFANVPTAYHLATSCPFLSHLTAHTRLVQLVLSWVVSQDTFSYSYKQVVEGKVPLFHYVSSFTYREGKKAASAGGCTRGTKWYDDVRRANLCTN